MSIRVIARQSRLSQLQVQEAMARFPEIDYLLETLSSYGDKHQQISLLNGEAPADMFTRELDEALISGRADIAIHSAKDLPYPLDDRLEVIALFPPFDQSDSLVSREHLTLAQLPAGSSVGTSSPMRRRELLALRPDLKIVGIRGCIEERVRQVRDGEIDAAIVATCALKRLGMEDDISEVLPFETHPLQGYLAITARRGRTDIKALFERVDVLHRQGHVTLVGFGPGDPELLTVKAVKALQQADVIFYDDLIGKDYLETLTAEKIYVGKRSGKHHAEQADIKAVKAEETATEVKETVEVLEVEVDGKVDIGTSNITHMSSTMYQNANGVNIYNDTLDVGDSYAHIDGDSFDIKEATTAGTIDDVNEDAVPDQEGQKRRQKNPDYGD